MVHREPPSHDPTLSHGKQGLVLGLYGDNGEEHENYYNGVVKGLGFGVSALMSTVGSLYSMNACCRS